MIILSASTLSETNDLFSLELELTMGLLGDFNC